MYGPPRDYREEQDIAREERILEQQLSDGAISQDEYERAMNELHRQ